MNIVEMMKEFNRPNVLFSSSATVYGDAEPPVTSARHVSPPRRPTATPKQIAEDILHDCCRAYRGLYGIALRYFNPIGAHPSAHSSASSPAACPTTLLPFITQTAAGIRKELSVFGNDYNTPDGTCLRDYIDVVDLAKAHVAAVDRMTSGKMAENYEIFNVGTGRPVSVLELVTTFEMVNGIKLPYKIVGRRSGDVPAVWADTALANDVLVGRPSARSTIPSVRHGPGKTRPQHLMAVLRNFLRSRVRLLT